MSAMSYKQTIIERLFGVVEEPYILGVRRLTKVNTFNDTLVIWMTSKKIYIEFNEFTTEPGIDYLRNPINAKGTAILKEGLHKDLWCLGLHQKKYEALVQCSPCVVYRDNNKDDKFDLINEDKGVFGINLHHAYGSSLVNKHSAGCQVLRKKQDLEFIINLFKKNYPKTKKYSYLLINEV